MSHGHSTNTSVESNVQRSEGSKLKAMLINCNSVKSTVKVSQKQAKTNSTNPDILFQVETKLDSSIPTCFFLPTNYEVIRKDRNTHGDGVLIALRNDIIADPQDKPRQIEHNMWNSLD